MSAATGTQSNVRWTIEYWIVWAVEAGTQFVMASHATYPALDETRIASQSPAVIEELLRDELGYDGVVMTDSLEAAAVQAVADVEEAAVASAQAGVDLILASPVDAAALTPGSTVITMPASRRRPARSTSAPSSSRWLASPTSPCSSATWGCSSARSRRSSTRSGIASTFST